MLFVCAHSVCVMCNRNAMIHASDDLIVIVFRVPTNKLRNYLSVISGDQSAQEIRKRLHFNER